MRGVELNKLFQSQLFDGLHVTVRIAFHAVDEFPPTKCVTKVTDRILNGPLRLPP
jgi:hypothetical protein